MVASACNEATSTVALVDDHELVRRGIKQILARDKCVKVVGEASDAPHAISMIKLLQPDVLLLDIHLREGSGLDVARACRTIAPKTSSRGPSKNFRLWNRNRKYHSGLAG